MADEQIDKILKTIQGGGTAVAEPDEDAPEAHGEAAPIDSILKAIGKPQKAASDLRTTNLNEVTTGTQAATLSPSLTEQAGKVGTIPMTPPGAAVDTTKYGFLPKNPVDLVRANQLSDVAQEQAQAQNPAAALPLASQAEKLRTQRELDIPQAPILPPPPQVSQEEIAKQVMASNTPGALGAQAAQGVNVADLPTSQAAGEAFSQDAMSGSKKLPLPYVAPGGGGLKTMQLGEFEKLTNDYLNDPSIPKTRGQAFAAGAEADTIKTLNDIFFTPIGLASGGLGAVSARALATAGKEGTEALKLAAEYQAMKNAGATAAELLDQEQKVKTAVAAAGQSQKVVTSASVAGKAAGGGFAAQGGMQVIDGIKRKDPSTVLQGLAGIAIGGAGVGDPRANVSEGVKAQTAKMAVEEFKKQGDFTAKRTPQATENAAVPPEQPKLPAGPTEGHIGPKEEPLAPEPLSTLKAQVDALAAGTNKVVYIPKGQEAAPPPPENAIVTVVPGDKAGAGTYYHTPDVSPALIQKGVDEGTFGKLLGNTQGKAEAIAGGKPTAIIARDESGTEIKSALADSTNPQAVAEQAAVLARQFPNAKIGVEPPEKVVSERLGVPAAEPAAGQEWVKQMEADRKAGPTSGLPDYIKEQRGGWFTPDQKMAQKYGSNLYAVDVPKDVSEATVYSDLPGRPEHLLPDVWQKKAKPIDSMGEIPDGMVRLFRGAGSDEKTARQSVDKILEAIQGAPAERRSGAGAPPAGTPERRVLPFSPEHQGPPPEQNRLLKEYRKQLAAATTDHEKESLRAMIADIEGPEAAMRMGGGGEETARQVREGREKSSGQPISKEAALANQEKRESIPQEPPKTQEYETAPKKPLFRVIINGVPREAPTSPKLAKFEAKEPVTKVSKPREKVQPLEEKYSPETLTAAREEMKRGADLAGTFERPGRFHTAADEGMDHAINSADRDHMMGIGSSRHIVGDQYPWYNNIKAGPQKLADLVKRGKGAEHDRILDDIAKGIEERKADAKAVAAEKGDELRATAAQVRSLDPALADELEALAAGEIHDVKDIKKFVAEKINDSKTTAEVAKAFEDYATETAADSELADGREPGSDEQEEPEQSVALPRIFGEVQRQPDRESEATDETGNKLAKIVKSKKITNDEIIAEAYRPGNVVKGYGGQYDKVLEFHAPDESKPYPDNNFWVRVIRSDKEGNPLPHESERIHSTPPEKNEALAAKARIEASRVAETEKQLKAKNPKSSTGEPGLIPGLHIIKYPSGKFGFVGKVPIDLSYEMADGSPISAKEASDIRQFGPGSPSSLKARGIKTLGWDSHEAAFDAAIKKHYGSGNGSVLPGMEKVVAEEKSAAGKVQAEKLTDEANTPKSIDKAAAEMESKSPLFRGTEASPQKEIFGLPRTAPGSTIPPKEQGNEEPVQPLGAPGEGTLEKAPSENVRGPGGERAVERPSTESGGPDSGGVSRRDREGDGTSRELASGEGEPPVPSGRGDAATLGGKHGQFTGSNQSGNDYRITPEDKIGEGGPKEKFNLNAKAIRQLHTLESEGRAATPAEQSTLIKYTGWGWTGNDLFNEDKPAWAKERQQLKDLLTPEEYAAARASTTNAHYTSPEIVEAVWAAVRRLGFTGGRMLEPSAGIGHFIGLMPSDIAGETKKTAIELDPISGRIMKQLYQNADVRIQGFQDLKNSPHTFDLAISNVPFGAYKVHDPAYNKLNLSIHNYFITKMLDQVRPGGLVAAITSHHTMDQVDSSVRKNFTDRADFLGAIRLPNSAFKKNAGTEVTTDMLFFRVRDPQAAESGESIKKLTQVRPGIHVNEYFATHPDMALGEHSLAGKMQAGKAEYTLLPGNEPIKLSLMKALMNLPLDAMKEYEAPESTTQDAMAEAIPDVGELKTDGLAVRDDKVYMKTVDGVKLLTEYPKKAVHVLKGMLGIRDAVRELFKEEAGRADPAELVDLRARLNRFYDHFVKKNGTLHTPLNRKAMGDDPDLPLILSLEKYNAKTKEAKKSDVFFKQTIASRKPVEHVETAKEALQVSLAEKGKLDFDRMSELTGRAPEDLQNDLRSQGVVFHSPEGHWETADRYLSGNVRKKLIAAQVAAAGKPEFAENVKALESVIPHDLTPSKIDFSLGATWIPASDIQNFVNNYILEDTRGTKVQHVQSQAIWTVTGDTWYLYNNSNNTTRWGIPEYGAHDLIEDALNGRQPTVYDKGVDGKQEVNVKRTEAAREKLEKIEAAFKKWLFSEEERSDRLVRSYNDKFNATVEWKPDGSHLTFPGMTSEVTMRAVQKNMIWRAVNGNNESPFHQVGLGKTYEGIAIAMEKRRLGLWKKPVIPVPNHMVEQWKNDWAKLYPGANVLAINKDEFSGEKRKEFVSRIATGDWDGVIIAHSSYGKIPTLLSTYNRIAGEQMDTLISYITEMQKIEGKKGRTVKQLEAAKRRLEAQMAARAARETKDDSLHFEELGIDGLIVDEAHEFKNLLFHTKMGRIAGIPASDSQKAFDMFLKVNHISKLNNGKNVHFMTGTPVSNTMAEVYNIARYLDPQKLKDLGVEHFDAWAKTFGKVAANWEVSPSNPSVMRVSNSFSEFTNIPELISIFRATGDVKYTKDVEGLVLPKANHITHTAQPSQNVKDYNVALGKRADKIKAGGVDPKDDNYLKITGEGRKLGLDYRMINPFAKEDPGSKLSMAATEIFNSWKNGESTRRTQIVFMDMGTPGKKEGNFNAYADLKNKLIAKGVPAKEIAFIHDVKKDDQKQELFDQMNDGIKRILIGSTQKMGVGTNVQRRVTDLHHIDAPWRPSDITQRNGRGERQGNENPEINIHYYVTEQTFDAYMWGLIERKNGFIETLLKNEAGVRTMEDVGARALSYGEIKANATGNPIILEKFKNDREVSKLQHSLAAHEEEQRDNKYKITRLERSIKSDEESKIVTQQDIAIRDKYDTAGDNFKIQVANGNYTDRKDAGQAINGWVEKNKASSEKRKIGKFSGFEIVADTSGNVYLDNGHDSHYYFEPNYENPLGTIAAMEAKLRNLENRIRGNNESIATYKTEIEKRKKLIGFPFEKMPELLKALERQKEIEAVLKTKEADNTIGADTKAEYDENGKIIEPEKKPPRDDDEAGFGSLDFLLFGIPSLIGRAVRALARARAPKSVAASPAVTPPAAPPPKGGIPTEPPREKERAGNIRLDKLNAPEDVINEIRRMAKEQGGEKAFFDQRRGVQSFGKTRDAAEKLVEEGMFTERDLKNMKAGSALNAEELLAARGMLIEQGRMVRAAAKQAAEHPTTENYLHFQEELQKQAGIQKAVSGAVAEAGRALSQQRMIANALKREDKSNHERVLEALGGQELSEEAARRLSQIPENDPVALNNFLRSQKYWTSIQKIESYWITNVLSSPRTPIKKGFGDVTLALLEGMNKGVEGAIDPILAAITGRKREAFMREAPVSALAAISAIPEGIRKAAFIMAHGFDQEAALAMEMPYRYEFPGGGKNPFNYPGRALQSVTKFFQVMAFQGELHAQAVRQAMKEGNRGEALRNRAAELVQHPTDAMVDASMHQAQLQTFTEAPDALARILMTMRDKVQISPSFPLIGGLRPMKFIIPFIQIPYNLTKHSFRYSPFALPRLSDPKVWRDKKAAGVLSRALIGSALMALFAYLAAKKSLTGAAPSSPAERDLFYRAGKQPFSMKIGNRWISYKILGPLALNAAAVAGWHDRMSKNDEQPLPDQILAATAAMGEALLQESFLAGMKNLVDALSDPAHAASRFATGIIGGFVPFESALRTTNDALDPTVRSPNGMYERILAGLPVVSARVPPKLDALGRESRKEGSSGFAAVFPGGISPTTPKSSIDGELDRLHGLGLNNIGFIGKTLTVDNVKLALSREERDASQKMRGAYIRAYLGKLFASAEYKAMTDEEKVAETQSAIKEAERDSHEETIDAVLNKRLKRSASIPRTAPTSAPAAP